MERMERRMEKSKRKLNNQGSAMIMALAVISFVVILGALSLSTALLNLKMRSLNRKSDRNFYYLETALDEIYARAGVVTAEQLKDSYAEIVGKLYQENMVKNSEANKAFSEDAMERLLTKFKLAELKNSPVSPDGSLTVTDEELCGAAADLLKGYSETFKEKNLDASIEAIILKQAEYGEDGVEDSAYNTLIFKGLCLTYTEPETAIQSSLTVDLQIGVPYIRFMNEGDALFDYVLVANEGIHIGEPDGSSGNWGGSEDEYDESIQGNVYGGFIDINRAHVQADSRLLISQGTLSIRNYGKLSMGYFGGNSGGGIAGEQDEENSEEGENFGNQETEQDTSGTGRRNSLWAQNLELKFNSRLTSEETDFYIQDDLTLKEGQNFVKLSGRYYGYGNEGAGADRVNDPNKSSAILMNDKNSTIDMKGLDTLMLAGRAYLRFSLEGENIQYVYPMGESLAVRATQAMYLIPEKDIVLEYGNVTYPAGSNPVVLPEGVNEAVVTAKISDEIPGHGKGEEIKFTITRGSSRSTETGKAGRIAADSPADPHALMIELNGKFYVYYDFNSDAERTAYFEWYLNENGENFDDYLRKSGVTGAAFSGPGEEREESEDGEKVGGIRINESGQVLTSGALYQVTGEKSDGDGQLFQLFELKKGETRDTLKWPQLSERLKTSFENLQSNLSETVRVKERAGEAGAGVILPAGNYVNLNKISEELAGEPCYAASLADGEGSVFLSADNLTVTLGADSAEIEIQGSHGAAYTVSGGLIVSSGNITVDSSGSGSNAVFNGLIIAEGTIDIVGKAEFTAEPETYQELLDDEEVSKYFYDYGVAASSVLSDYTAFVTRENWVRAGRKAEGEEQ